jgi:hypothetical protein
MESNLDAITLRVELSKTSKMKFLIDMGAEIPVVRNISLKPVVGSNVKVRKQVEVAP